MKRAASEPAFFDLALPTFTLEAGATLPSHHARGCVWSTDDDHRALHATLQKRAPNAFDPGLPTVLIVPALVHDCRFGGPGGFWDALVGEGRPLRPWAHRIVAFDLLGSCFGTTGPHQNDFPKRVHDARFPACPPLVRGMPRHDENALPATVTTWDQARSILLSLDALGIDRVSLAIGGSLGGMIALCLAMLDPLRFTAVSPIATPLAASAWMIGWNHTAREAILADPEFPNATRGLKAARQIARMTYRSPLALEERQGRRIAGPTREGVPAWSSRTPYRVETYLDHQAESFSFDARAYIALTQAMDHHDLLRCPFAETSDEARAWSLARIKAKIDLVAIDSDVLVQRAEIDALHRALTGASVDTEAHVVTSNRGHDAFLSDHTEMHRLLSRVLRRSMETA